jgi:hypothetical protein
MLRELTADEVEFALDCMPEDAPVHGNASAIDDETDTATEAWIRGELSRGNEWAWCVVRVTAKWRGYVGHDFLGGCSYVSEEEFRRPDGYFTDMKARALEALNEAIADHARKLEPLLV